MDASESISRRRALGRAESRRLPSMQTAHSSFDEGHAGTDAWSSFAMIASSCMSQADVVVSATAAAGVAIGLAVPARTHAQLRSRVDGVHPCGLPPRSVAATQASQPPVTMSSIHSRRNCRARCFGRSHESRSFATCATLLTQPRELSSEIASVPRAVDMRRDDARIDVRAQAGRRRGHRAHSRIPHPCRPARHAAAQAHLRRAAGEARRAVVAEAGVDRMRPAERLHRVRRRRGRARLAGEHRLDGRPRPGDRAGRCSAAERRDYGRSCWRSGCAMRSPG